MPVASSQKKMTGRHLPTKVEGVHKSVSPRTGKVTWEARYRDSTGKYVYETCPTFEDAKARRAEMANKGHRGELVVNSTATLSDVLAGWHEWRNIKPRTEKTYDDLTRIHIVPKFGRSRVRDITRADVRAWLNSMNRKDGRDGAISEGTKAVVCATLSNIFDYCVDAGMIGDNPCRTLGKAKPRQGKIEARILGDGELEALLASCERFKWLRDIIKMTLYGALRLGEVCGLEWQDIDFDTGRITVRQQVGKDGTVGGTPKGGKVESIPMSPQARRLLAELKLAAQDKSPGAPVFTTALGGYRGPRNVQCAFVKARRYAGLTNEPRALRFHDLRHTSISMLANMAGADMMQVQAFARHASMQTTLAYCHKVEKPEWTDTVGKAFEAFGS
jgi:integrase